MLWRDGRVLIFFAFLIAPASAICQDTRPGVAVLEFVNGGSYGQDAQDFAALQVGLQQILITELARNSAMRLVERGRIDELMAEQDLGSEGRVNAGTASAIGRIVGAKFVVLGSFVDFFGDFRIDVRIVDVETSEFVKTDHVSDKRDELYRLVVDLAKNLTENVDLPELSDVGELEEQAREIPTGALTLYSRAIFFEDRGDRDRAIELYSRALDEFPAYTEANEALQQLRRRS